MQLLFCLLKIIDIRKLIANIKINTFTINLDFFIPRYLIVVGVEKGKITKVIKNNKISKLYNNITKYFICTSEYFHIEVVTKDIVTKSPNVFECLFALFRNYQNYLYKYHYNNFYY